MFNQLTESEVHEHIATAMATAAATPPESAIEATINKLSGAFGPVITKIIDLIKSGLTNLPDILAALAAAGVALPPWAGMIITILLALVKPAA